MPLSTPVSRRPDQQRAIRCEGFLRDDGLWDVDGVLIDTRCTEIVNEYRTVPPGGSIHEMHLRLTVDDALTIRALELAMDHHPYAYCSGVIPNFQRLVGLTIGPGFSKKLFKEVGHAQGCTHVVWLIQCCATVALRTVAGKVGIGDNSTGAASVFGTGPGGRPGLLGTCHSYAPQSPVVATIWPAFYTGPSTST